LPFQTSPIASIDDVVFHVANALRVPVLIAALLALVVVLVEAGALAAELVRRRRRTPEQLREAVTNACVALDNGEPAMATQRLGAAAVSDAMRAASVSLIAEATAAPDADEIGKSVADFDLGSLRRLELTRFLVRAGPALGLMGTLIPLSPALSALANGNITELTAKLRVAFSVTVLGLLVGVVAFGISLVRDRMYAQDLSDVEYIAAKLEARTKLGVTEPR
jgi:biopolymer transport protein ExbB/TolQ